LLKLLLNDFGFIVKKSQLSKRTGLRRVLFCLVVLPVLLSSAAFATEGQSLWQGYVAKGDSALSLQRLAEAESDFRLALKAVAGEPHDLEDVVKCQNRLANVLTLENQPEEAKRLYSRSLKTLERKYGQSNPKIVETLLALSSVYESEGDVSVAMKSYQRAFAINEKNYGPYSPEVAKSLHKMGHASVTLGDPKKAEQHYKQAIGILEKESGLDASKELEDTLQDYGDLLRKTDNTPQALVSDFQKEVLKDPVHPTSTPVAKIGGSAWAQQMSQRSSTNALMQTDVEQNVMLRGTMQEPFSSENLKPIYQTMGDVLSSHSSYEQSEPQYKRMIAIDIKSLGPNHPSVADDLIRLAKLYITQKRYEDAQIMLNRALSIYESNYGSDNLIVIRTRALLASVYSEMGKPDQAASLYQQSLNQAKTTLGPNNLETAQLLNDIAFLYYREGKLEDAGTFYKWALASTEATVGTQDPLVAACLKDYARVLQAQGKTTEAAEAEARANGILANAINPNNLTNLIR
jgi:tetratricopeptide (TPR) repeat protein